MISTNDLINTVTMVHSIKGNANESGTCFFYKYHQNNRENYLLISNKHVLCGDAFKFTVPIKNDSETHFLNNSINISPSYHDTYDLAVIGINDLIDTFQYKDYKLNIQWLTQKDVLSVKDINNMSYIEEVFMLGYPYMLIGNDEIFPIIKRGITATPLCSKYNNREEFLTDIIGLDGCSGAPVYVRINDSYKLAGIHYAKLLSRNANVGLSVNIKSTILTDWIKAIL